MRFQKISNAYRQRISNTCIQTVFPNESKFPHVSVFVKFTSDAFFSNLCLKFLTQVFQTHDKNANPNLVVIHV